MGKGSNIRVLIKRIEGVQCSFCQATIEKALKQLPGVEEVSINMAHEELLVRYDEELIDEETIRKVLSGLGFSLVEPQSATELALVLYREKKSLLYSAILSAIIGILMIYMRLSGSLDQYVIIASGFIAFVNLVFLGGRYLSMAWNAVKRGILNQHVLMSATALSGLIGGFAGILYDPQVFPPLEFFGVSSFVTTYHILGGYASVYVRKRSSEAIKRLLELQPASARVLRDGKWVIVPVDRVKPGDMILVKPGERIPVDGVISEGSSSLDESLVTGESLPVDKSVGSEVIAGSLNIAGYLVIKATRGPDESFIARIAKHMREVRALKPGVIQLLDSVLKYYVPWVLIVASIALITWATTTILTGYPGFKAAFYSFLAVLVMGYPCALGMSVPLAMIKGGYIAARKGILFRSSEAFHILSSKPGVVVFDKTGTLTKGRISVYSVYPDEGFDSVDVLRLAACIESYSTHPIAVAIVEEASRRLVTIDCGVVEGFRELPGKGVRGLIDSTPIAVGKLSYLIEEGYRLNGELAELAGALGSKGYTVVGVGIDKVVAGLIALSDELRDNAKNIVDELRSLGFKVAMLTGDSRRVADRVAREVGIDSYEAELTPEGKTLWIRRIQAKGEKVVMVGDGVNDAPALTLANVGIALSKGADIAVESADIVLIGDKLANVPESIRIAKYMYRTTKENLVIAFVFNGIGVPAAALGLLQPYWAMIAMIASVSLILANTFLLRKIKEE